MYKILAACFIVAVYFASQSEAATSLLIRNGTSLAGQNGLSGFDDGPAVTVAKLSGPTCVLYVPSTNSLLVGDNTVIRNVTNGNVSTIFGTANQAGTVDGTRNSSKVNSPSALREINGKFFFTEPLSNVLRCIDGENLITVAGYVGSTSSVDGVGLAASFQQPSGLAIGSDGALYTADRGSNSIRRINTTTFEVTTVLTGVLVPSDIVGMRDVLYIINRPAGGSTIGVYTYNITSGTGQQWIATAQPFVTLGTDKENKRLFGATQNRIYEILANGTFTLYAGSGSSFSNGENPTFRSITQMCVVSYRQMYIATGSAAYVVRGLFFDPPPPIALTLTISYPGVYFPVDNATEMASLIALIQGIVNTNLNATALPDGSPSTDVNPLATITGFTYNATTNEITFAISVPNMTYTPSSNSTVQDVTQYTAAVTAQINQYYSATQLSVTADYWTVPTSNATAMAELTSLVREDLRRAFQYNHLQLAAYTSMATQTSASLSWKLLAPPTFDNSTSTAILSALKTPAWSPSALDLFPLAGAFLANYYIADINVALDSKFVLPVHQPVIMYNIRQAVRQDAATALGQPLPNVGNYAPASVDSSVFKILISARVGISNTTAQSQLSSSAFSSVKSAINAAYPSTATVTFDGTLFPWSDPVAVATLRDLLIANLSGTFNVNSSSPEVFLFQQMANVTGPSGYQNVTFTLAGLPSITPAALQAAVLAAQQDPSISSYLQTYYDNASSIVGGSVAVTVPQLTVPLSDPNAMETLRRLIAQDLAAALGINNTGVNFSSPSFLFSTTSPATGGSLESLGFPSANSNVTFELLLPLTGINSSTAQLLAQAIANGLPSVTNFLQQYYNSTQSTAGTPSVPLPATVPASNSTAMEDLREVLVERLRAELNATLGNLSTDALLVSVNVLPYDPVTNTFPIQIPAFLASSPFNVNVTQLVANTTSVFTTSDLPTFLDGYYTTPFTVELPYDITPWSNTTTMSTLYTTYLLQDIRQTLKQTYPQVASLSDAQLPIVLRGEPVVSKANSTVTWTILLPPYPFNHANSTMTQAALDAAPLSNANQYLYQYFPKDLVIALSGNDIPLNNATVLEMIGVLLRNQLAANLGFENVGVNGSHYVSATDTVLFKVILPPQWNSSATDLVSNTTLLSSDLNATTGLQDLIDASFAQDVSVFFIQGYLPDTNTTAMGDIRALLRLDVQDLFGYSPIGVASSRNFTNTFDDSEFDVFDLRVPLSFSNGTTTALLVNASYPRVVAYLARNFPPAPPPAVFNYSVNWPISIMPTANATQMALLQEALRLDAVDALGYANVSGFPFRISDDGQSVIYDILLPNDLNNVGTGSKLEAGGWPRFQKLLAELTQGNLQGTGGATGAQSVDEGCSRGCVIAVAAIGAAIVTAGVIAAIVITSKRKRLATVVASNGAHKNSEGRPPAPAFTPVFDDQGASPAKNPLDMP